MEERTEWYPRPLYLAVRAFIPLLLLGLMVWAAGWPHTLASGLLDEFSPSAIRAVGTVGAIGLAITTAPLVILAATRRPAVEATPTALVDRTRRGWPQRIPWDEITHIEPAKQRRGSIVQIKGRRGRRLAVNAALLDDPWAEVETLAGELRRLRERHTEAG
jgi:hypothetical protein